jgi:RHS repeat-associated protein
MRPDSAAWFANGRNRAVKPGELEAGSFDAAGNLTKAGVLRLEYDGENRLAKAVGSGSTTYEYDGLGRRVTKQEAGGTLTYYVYDAFGGLAAEYLPTGPSSPAGTHYLSTDHLGSTRLVTNANGDVVSRHDYLPFGEEIPNTVGNRQSVAGYAWNGSLTQRFTGKERDGETGLDYFESRYFSAAQGRFTSPDAMMGKPEWVMDPQRWNRYAYVRNNPLKFVDPNGEDLVIYYSLGSDVSQEDRDWFNKNKAAVLGAIQKKFEAAGVNNVSLRDQSTLSTDQVAELDKGSPFGVSRLTLVGKDYPGLGLEWPPKVRHGRM